MTLRERERVVKQPEDAVVSGQRPGTSCAKS